MAAFVTDPGALLWGATAVPNAFFCEYMPSAPEGYVKVYLYGYMAAQGGLGDTVRMVEDLAIALGMETEQVEKALRYWERCRLLERVRDNPPQYRYLSVGQAVVMRQQTQTDEQYEALKEKLESMLENKDRYHYNYVGLFLAGVKIPYRQRRCYYCSEFVKEMLVRHGIRGADQLASIVEPMHFLQLPDANYVYCGKLRDFAEKQGNNSCKHMHQKRKMHT